MNNYGFMASASAAMGMTIVPAGGAGVSYGIVQGTGLAVLSVAGPLVRGMWYDADADIGNAMRHAAANPQVKAVLALMDSPGGTAIGASELLDAAKTLSRSKPFYAAAVGVCASKCYWLASQATEIVALPTAVVGSIGIVSVVYDESERFKMMGVRPVVTRTPDEKALGQPGEPIDDRVTSQVEAINASIYDYMVADIASGTGMSPEQIRGTNGRVYMGEEAVRAGLVSRIVPSLNAYAAELADKYKNSAAPMVPATSAKGATKMSNEAKPTGEAGTAEPRADAPIIGPVAATAGELKEAGIEAAFAFECLSSGLSLVDSLKSWSRHLASRPVSKSDPKPEAIPTGVAPQSSKESRPTLMDRGSWEKYLAALRGMPLGSGDSGIRSAARTVYAGAVPAGVRVRIESAN